MLIDEIRTQLQEATKRGESQVVQTLRLLVSALEYKKIQKQADFTAADELAVVRAEAKKRQEAIEIFTRVGQLERAALEKQELAILEQYLPAQVGEAEVRKVVEDLKSKAPGKGQLIGMVMGKIGKDKVDGNLVARIVNEFYD